MKSNAITTLEKVNYNKVCCVKDFIPNTTLSIKNLCNIGITKNAQITPLYSSVFKGTKAYLIKGSVISLRDSDAQNIIVNID